MAELNDSLFILPINRPQYMVASEVFISSLAWRAYDTAYAKDFTGINGFVYKKPSDDTKSLSVHAYMPQDVSLEAFDEALRNFGLTTGFVGAKDATRILGDAVSNSVLGTKSPRSKSQPASPLSPSFALMQNLAGLLNKKGPADVGLILEAMFALGAPANYEGPSASTLLGQAMEYRLDGDPLLRVMDEAASSVLLGHELVRIDAKLVEPGDWWQTNLRGTPFSWLFDKWLLITRRDWVEALPSKVWIDWATTVLRLGLAMGYLWEAAWYEALSKKILGDSSADFTLGAVRRHMSEPLVWNSGRLGTAMRDVSSPMKKRINQAHGVKDLIQDWLQRNGELKLPFEQLLSRMNRDPELRSDLVGALNPSGDVGKNTREAVQYALTTREDRGNYADYYGLLARRGTRYLEPAPGIEWIAVVASLACAGPKETCDAGDLMRELGHLGARPELRDLIEYLERAGLARGSADADQGVVVESAF